MKNVKRKADGIGRIPGLMKFKSLVLWIERRKHMSKGRILKNYHPKDFTNQGLSNFRWYLFYNMGLHIIGSIIVFTAGAILLKVGHLYRSTAIMMIGAVAINIYCIFLQLFNLKKIDGTLEAKRKREDELVKRICAAVDENPATEPDREEYQMDLVLLDQMEALISKNEELTVTEAEKESLKRYLFFLNRTGAKWIIISKKNRITERCVSEENKLLDASGKRKADKAVRTMRRIFDRSRYELEQSEIALVSDEEGLELIRTIFGVDIHESGPVTLRILRYIYEEGLKPAE